MFLLVLPVIILDRRRKTSTYIQMCPTRRTRTSRLF